MEIHHESFAVRQDQQSFVEALASSGVQVLSAGIPLGHWKGRDWFPAHGLAMSPGISPRFDIMTLDHEQALDYLRADSGSLPACSGKETWILAGYASARLGWIKNVAGKAKNYLPKNQRIHSL